VSKMSTFTKVW